MIRHLLKMVWNRKRVNGLIIVEIFVSFIVLFVVLTAAAYYITNYRKPLGYDIANVWRIQADSHLPEKGFGAARVEGFRTLERVMKEQPEVAAAGFMYAPPYARSTWSNGRKFNGNEIFIEINRADDGVREVLGMPLTAGRWFSKEDDASKLTPVVVNEEYAKLMFGAADPIGKSPLDSTCRIVGVMVDFRKGGEFSAPGPYQIHRTRLSDTTENTYGSFIVRVRPGTTAEFQGKLAGILESAEAGWSFSIETLERERSSDFRLRLSPLIAGGVVAGFLLIMVAFGLTGVLWQNVSQRTKEIGLRRALGGSAEQVSRQIRGEQLVITTLGAGGGAILVLQLPLLDLIGFIEPGVYAASLAASLILIYALTYLCSMFPSWLAMDVRPAEALHYE